MTENKGSFKDMTRDCLIILIVLIGYSAIACLIMIGLFPLIAIPIGIIFALIGLMKMSLPLIIIGSIMITSGMIIRYFVID